MAEGNGLDGAVEQIHLVDEKVAEDARAVAHDLKSSAATQFT